MVTKLKMITKKWPHGGSSQSVAQLQHHSMILKLTGITGTGGQTDKQADRQDHVLSQADALTKIFFDNIQLSQLQRKSFLKI